MIEELNSKLLEEENQYYKKDVLVYCGNEMIERFGRDRSIRIFTQDYLLMNNAALGLKNEDIDLQGVAARRDCLKKRRDRYAPAHLSGDDKKWGLFPGGFIHKDGFTSPVLLSPKSRSLMREAVVIEKERRRMGCPKF